MCVRITGSFFTLTLQQTEFLYSVFAAGGIRDALVPSLVYDIVLLESVWLLSFLIITFDSKIQMSIIFLYNSCPSGGILLSDESR